MRDPLSWSVPLFRVFGITVRLHVLFPVVTGALLLRVSFPREGQVPVLFSDAQLILDDIRPKYPNTEIHFKGTGEVAGVLELLDKALSKQR